MVYTLTLNPAVDYYMDIGQLSSGTLNRSAAENFSFGGKGINVSRMLTALGVPNKAVAVLGGFTGKMCEESARAEGLDIIPVYTDGITRINVKLSDGTELNGSGCELTQAVLDKVFDVLSSAQKGDVVMLCGSIGKGVSSDIYAAAVHQLKQKGVLTAVDADGDALKRAAEEKPFVIKPNTDELGRLCGCKITDGKAAMDCALRLYKIGIQNVLVSMASDGALLVKEHTYQLAAPRVQAVTTIGAGDSMLAGFIYAHIHGMRDEDKLAFAVKCGSARVKTGEFCNIMTIKALFQ